MSKSKSDYPWNKDRIDNIIQKIRKIDQIHINTAIGNAYRIFKNQEHYKAQYEK